MFETDCSNNVKLSEKTCCTTKRKEHSNALRTECQNSAFLKEKGEEKVHEQTKTCLG